MKSINNNSPITDALYQKHIHDTYGLTFNDWDTLRAIEQKAYTLKQALDSIKQDYEFVAKRNELNVHENRAHAYYETARDALLKAE